MFRERPAKNVIFFLISMPFLILACSCATTGSPTAFSVGEMKNSLPLTGREQLADVHSVVIVQFHNDEHGWKDVSSGVFSSLPGISVISSGTVADKVEKASRDFKKDFLTVGAEERPELLGRVGKSLQSDAVLNGVILPADKRHEIILQLVSSKDSRILWWQAVEFSFGEPPSTSDQKALIERMIASLRGNIGKNIKAAAPPPVKSLPKVEDTPKTDGPSKPETPAKTGAKPKKPDKGKKAEDISPM